MSQERFDKFYKDIEAVMEKHGYSHFEGVEMDSNRKVNGPYFGRCIDEGKDNVVLIGFSLSGEKGCPCCMGKSTEE